MVRIDMLHNECIILGLEQRRRKQLLRLIYLHSKNDDNIKKPTRQTKAVTKIVFKTATKCTGNYLGSPFYRGTLLWNLLSPEEQCSNTVLQFVHGLKKLYTRYQEIW